MDGVVESAVRKVLLQVAPLIRSALGEGATVCELSALVSDPGASAQPVHHDTEFGVCPRRISVLCALQDVCPDMGPTTLWPGTHTPEWHACFQERGPELEALLEGQEEEDAPGGRFGPVKGVLRAGDALLYDTNLLHCGGENRSEAPGRRRALLVISAQVEERGDGQGGCTAATSGGDLHTNIRTGLRGRFAIDRLEDWP